MRCYAIFLLMDADGSDYVDKEEFKSIFLDMEKRRGGLAEIANVEGVVSRTVS